MHDVAGYATALGLATAAGLNAWFPLLAVGLLGRYTDLVHLGGGAAQDLTHTAVLLALGAVTAADFVGDKVPGVDHVLHAAGTVIAPASGVVAGLASTHALDVSPVLITILALGAAGTAHGTRMAARPFSTVGTAGIGNPVLSLIEDGLAALLAVSAILAPALAVVLVVLLFAAGWWLIRRLRARAAAARARLTAA